MSRCPIYPRSRYPGRYGPQNPMRPARWWYAPKYLLNIRPDLAARVVGSFPWDTRWHEHVAERLARERAVFG